VTLMARWAPARADVIGEYADEVLQLFPQGRILVGIDGLDGAGKTTFAHELAAAIRDRGVASAAVSLDGFHAAREIRHQGPDDARTWYANAYDYDAFRRLVIEPFRAGTPVALEYRSRENDAVLDHPARFRPEERSVLIVEGVFLHRKELVGLWHTSAWLDVPMEVALARTAERDGTDPDPTAEINRRYFGAEEAYLREADPRRRAIASFTLVDAAHPRRIFADAC
jgi:uridine kinase